MNIASGHCVGGEEKRVYRAEILRDGELRYQLEMFFSDDKRGQNVTPSRDP